MPVSIRLLALTAAQHQCTFGTTSPSGSGQFQVRFAGTPAFAIRVPNGTGNSRLDMGQLQTATTGPTGGAAVELCIADGTDHVALLTFLRDVDTYIRANNPRTDQMDAQMMVSGLRTVADCVRANAVRS